MSDLEDKQIVDLYWERNETAAWNSMPPNRPNILSTYLGKLTRRISIDRFRAKTSQKRGGGEYELSLEELNQTLSGGDTTEETVEAKLLTQSMEAFLRCLPAETRHVFLGRYYFLDSVKEIAAYCRISESKVKILLHRTRQRLRDHLEKEGFL